MLLAQSAYLRSVGTLDDDLAIRDEVTDPLTTNQARRLRRGVERLKREIRAARERYEDVHGPVYVEPPPES